MIKEIHHSCQGESHKVVNKVCQDYSYGFSTEKTAIAIVCDGHGGERYFRSDVGSRIASEVIHSCVDLFLESIDKQLFKGKPYTKVGTVSSEAIGKLKPIDYAFRQLFSSIIYNWSNRILEHAQNTPLTEIEKEKVQQKYQDDFQAGVSLEKTYGCTLMCFVRTQEFWFAFHLGDGKCIAFDTEHKWYEPIPWDERCFLNKTTSLCDSDALNEFRYCYQGDGSFPFAVFIGSDGIDDSFGETENMVNFYVQVIKMLANEEETALTTIKETLPALSKRGSQDDMSIACVYDTEKMLSNIPILVEWQRGYVEKQIQQTNSRIEKYKEKLAYFNGRLLNNQKEIIDFQYAKNEIVRCFEQKRNLINKWNVFTKEIAGENAPEYSDEIGLDADLIFEQEVPSIQEDVKDNDNEGTENTDSTPEEKQLDESTAQSIEEEHDTKNEC